MRTLRRKHRRSVAIATAATAAMALSLCPSAVASASGTTLTVQLEADNAGMQTCAIKLFENENPGVTVQEETISSTQDQGSNLTVLTSANPPDVGTMGTNTAVYPRILAAHGLSPIPMVWSKDNLSMTLGPGAAGLYTVNGQQYVVPVDKGYYNLIFYNVALFKKLGIPQPVNHQLASFAQFANIAKELQKSGYYGMAMAGASGYESSWMIDTFLNTTATPAQYGNYVSQWKPTTKITSPVTAAPFVKALDAIQLEAQDKIFQPGWLGVTQTSQAEALFLAQKAGMLLDNNVVVQSVLDAKTGGASFPYNWTLFPPAPGSKETNVMSAYEGDSLGIPAGAKNKALAEKYLELIGSTQGQMCDVSTGNIPVITTLPASA